VQNQPPSRRAHKRKGRQRRRACRRRICELPPSSPARSLYVNLALVHTCDKHGAVSVLLTSGRCVSVKGARARACADRQPPPPPADCARESATSTQTITSNSAVSAMGRVMHPEYATCMQTSTLLRGERASICRRARKGGDKRNARARRSVAVARRSAHDQHVHTPLCTCGTVVSRTRCWTYPCARNYAAGSLAARLDVVSPAQQLQRLDTLGAPRRGGCHPPFLRRTRSNDAYAHHLSYLLRMLPTEAFPTSPQMAPL